MPRQIGWSLESNLLYSLKKQIQKQAQAAPVTTTTTTTTTLP